MCKTGNQKQIKACVLSLMVLTVNNVAAKVINVPSDKAFY